MYFQCWSGGKDSTASIILEHTHNLPLSTIIFSEVMFDNNRNISGEFPEHIKWVYNVAKPTFESLGHTVKIVRSDKDYLKLFFGKPKSKVADRADKYRGFLLGGRCTANRDLKIKPIHDYFKSLDCDYIQYVGIAVDEPTRLKRLEGTNCVSLLARYGFTENMAYDLCKQFKLLSPIYENSQRGGCWFCPNSRLSENAFIKQRHPELWSELEKLSLSNDLISYGYKYGKTFQEVDAEVDQYIIRQQFDSLQIKLDI